MIDLEKEILQIVERENGRPIPLGIIFKKIEPVFKIKRVVYQTVDKMVEAGVFKLTDGKVVLANEKTPLDEEHLFDGEISLNFKGDGFVKPDNSTEVEYYIGKRNLNTALDGDRVKCAPVLRENNKRLKEAVVIEVLERGKDFFTATFWKDSEGYKVVADDIKMTMPIFLDDTEGLVDGHKILVKIARFEGEKAYGSVSKIIGHKHDVGTDIASVLYDNGVEPEFSAETENYLKSSEFKAIVDEQFSEHELAKREDLRRLNFITIDPATSKDLDDSIYVEKINDSNDYKLIVAIADVSYFVTYDSPLDKEALQRGTSIYLVDRVVPMLPHLLSNDLCSLNPRVDRLALACEIIISKNAEFKSIEVFPAVINSKRQFSYDEVNKFFDKKDELVKDSDDIKEMLKTSFELYKILKKDRKAKGYINFEIPEPKIILNDKGEITDIQKKETGDAQMMIESFMVAANEAVTIKFNEHHKKFVYRVHSKPEAKKLAAFEIEAKKLNFKIDDEIKNLQSSTIARWLEENKNNPNKDLINMILLRTMPKAKYATINIGHFGLASKQYTHFTSPIRRYPDLEVHRLFRFFYFIKEKDQCAEFRGKVMNELRNICELSTDNEIEAVSIEREVNSMKFAEFMEKKIGHEYDGFVSFVTRFGVFVQLDNTIEGLVRPNNMLSEEFEFNQDELTFVARNNKTTLTLGTKVKISVLGANKDSRKIDFKIIQVL